MVADNQGRQRQGGLTGQGRTTAFPRFPPERIGQEIEARFPPCRVFKARINAINSASDQTTRRVVVRSEIENAMRRTYCTGPAAGIGAAFVSCVAKRASVFPATVVLPSKRMRYTARFSITRWT